MTSTLSDRRAFLGIAIGAAASVVIPHRLGAQAAIGAMHLSGNIYLLTGAGANVVARTGEGGVVLVDGGRTDRSTALLDAVGRLPGGGPVTTLVNTHWHPDQTGSNLALGRRGATIIAHENTRLWLTTDVTWPWGDETIAPPPEAARPNKTFYDSGESRVGSDTLRYAHMLQAHTDGDIYVHFPEANVLVTGGVVSNDQWPLVDWWTGGWINGMVDGIGSMLDVVDDDTIIVPADGPVMTRTELEAQAGMYGELAEQIREIMYSGLAPDDAVERRLTEGFSARLGGDADFFVRRAFESLWSHLTPDA